MFLSDCWISQLELIAESEKIYSLGEWLICYALSQETLNPLNHQRILKWKNRKIYILQQTNNNVLKKNLKKELFLFDPVLPDSTSWIMLEANDNLFNFGRDINVSRLILANRLSLISKYIMESNLVKESVVMFLTLFLLKSRLCNFFNIFTAESGKSRN